MDTPAGRHYGGDSDDCWDNAGAVRRDGFRQNLGPCRGHLPASAQPADDCDCSSCRLGVCEDAVAAHRVVRATAARPAGIAARSDRRELGWQSTRVAIAVAVVDVAVVVGSQLVARWPDSAIGWGAKCKGADARGSLLVSLLVARALLCRNNVRAGAEHRSCSL